MNQEEVRRYAAYTGIIAVVLTVVGLWLYLFVLFPQGEFTEKLNLDYPQAGPYAGASLRALSAEDFSAGALRGTLLEPRTVSVACQDGDGFCRLVLQAKDRAAAGVVVEAEAEIRLNEFAIFYQRHFSPSEGTILYSGVNWNAYLSLGIGAAIVWIVCFVACLTEWWWPAIKSLRPPTATPTVISRN